MALAALALVVFGAIDCPPYKIKSSIKLNVMLTMIVRNTTVIIK